MKEIDVKKLMLLSERGNSKTYLSEDNKWIIKFSNENVGNALIDYKKKQFLSQFVDSLHINTPKARDIVCDNDGNLALEYEYVEDKISYARKVSINPDNVEKYMNDLSCFVKKIHKAKVNKEYLLSIEETVEKTLFVNKNIFDEVKIKKIKNIMSKIDNTGTFACFYCKNM